ncbi:hypothetical protein MCHLDSM_00265 [Mycolicibacterium chlorophenolicum]|uniref:Polyketide cyclase / dehydrase and lipid transport n=2 Tax=Mycolicibacterium chlorophenolicum TaxID=37916 RepID=A0A0J6WKE1_9MYCO|nr:hypothetical protein MCHLDSM_00265 [Mycolicibacterium chlorophenolicum]
MPGDDLVAIPDVVMDRAFTLDAPPSRVWPWFAQLGRHRAGWYMPRWIEAIIPPRKRALRHIDPSLQHLAIGDVIPDWGGRNATFEIVVHHPPHILVHRSRRGRLLISWAITLTDDTAERTRVHLRFRVSGTRHRRLMRYGGEAIDLLTVALLAAGLRERVTPSTQST